MSDYGGGRATEIAVAAGLGALSAFQGYVQEADAKINSMLVVHTGAVVAVVTTLGLSLIQDSGTVRSPMPPSPCSPSPSWSPATTSHGPCGPGCTYRCR